KSQRAVRGWKRNCGSSSPVSSWQWVRQRRRPFSARDSESRGSAAKCCPRSLRQGCSRLFIRRRFFASQMRNRANANTSISLRICAPRYVLLVKNKDSALKELSFHRHRISHFVFSHEGLAKLVETPRLYFSAYAVHEVQIEMQVVERDQAKSENLLRLDEVANVAA